ncbi:MAG: ChaN family lipoprotein [Polaromonas sp.]|nr:ChaN family lipoprotein [Polaromonas sp.]NDP63344.1 ChaN family lipoprotein [Polaromonas sp.]
MLFTSRSFLPCRFALLLAASSALMAAGCAGRPELPILEQTGSRTAARTATRLEALLPADVLLVGEQHDAPEHHELEQQIVSSLASRGLLAAVALEMAEVGVSTAQLKPSSTEDQARRALKWDDKSWPWADYGPAVMTAVRAGVPVLGANLPRDQMPASMNDSKLDAQLPGPALKAQQQGIRIGHCNLLPESQITPMTRIQIAKDITMADTVHQLLLPGKTVVLLTGNGHADRTLGVPQHLRADVKAKSLQLRAGDGDATDRPDAFDGIWPTPALPETDYCAELKAQWPAAGK